jgi:hypothetical protein
MRGKKNDGTEVPSHVFRPKLSLERRRNREPERVRRFMQLEGCVVQRN